MARTQAADYEHRRASIVAVAAQLYAERGFLGASLADLAGACKMTKSLIYHYYSSKEDILFAVMESHVRDLLLAAETVAAKADPPPTKLKALTHEFLRLYVGAEARHRVLLNELNRLPPRRRNVIVAIQRKLIDIVCNLILEIQPGLARHTAMKRPAAMLYFGMINWTHTWMDPQGRATPETIADLAADVFLRGITDARV
jgi:AcrR family transcriptional regulator